MHISKRYLTQAYIVRPTTSSLNFFHAKEQGIRPMFQVFSNDNSVPNSVNKLDTINLYSFMVRLNTMDRIFYDAQRQGRISFYMTSYGEEAAVIGSAAGLDPTDEVFAQYREQGVLLWRGFSLENFADQLFGNSGDVGKGRAMPVHYGSKELHFQTISSPLATQIPHAAGYAYSLKTEKKRIACCYFGEGAASEGDFHAGMNFAATLNCPVLFICRNNGYAISTSTIDQYASDGIVNRAIGYGISSLRVDGNDIFAMRQATASAREYVLREQKPCLIEAMTYRAGHHSTSDDSTRYRSIEEIESWKKNYNPLEKIKNLLITKNWMTEEEDRVLKDEELEKVLFALKTAEMKSKPNMMASIFDDVYDKLPLNLVQQKAELETFLKKYPIDE
jgi:2-oxoisovalerate dehydrogenase E1 component alpha subunit